MSGLSHEGVSFDESFYVQDIDETDPESLSRGYDWDTAMVLDEVVAEHLEEFLPLIQEIAIQDPLGVDCWLMYHSNRIQWVYIAKIMHSNSSRVRAAALRCQATVVAKLQGQKPKPRKAEERMLIVDFIRDPDLVL